MAELEEFPRDRFELADATAEEIDQLEHEYERSDIGMQQDSIEHYRSQSTGGLRDYLENLRELGHFATEDEGDEPEFDEGSTPDGQEQAPVGASGPDAATEAQTLDNGAAAPEDENPAAQG